MRRAAVPLSWLALSLAVLALVVVSTPAVGQAPKSGGVLNVMQRGDLAQGRVKGRPYLDGLKYVVIVERGTRFAALQAGRLDVSFPGEATKPIADQLKASGARLVFTQVGTNVNDNLLMNVKKPPFDNVKVRRALSPAIDRRAYARAVHQSGAVIGAAMQPKPYGFWGLLDKDLNTLPGYGTPEHDKAKARKLLAEAGFTGPITSVATSTAASSTARASR